MGADAIPFGKLDQTCEMDTLTMNTTPKNIPQEIALLEQIMASSRSQGITPSWYLEGLEKEIQEIKKANYSEQHVIWMIRAATRARSDSDEIQEGDPVFACLEKIYELISPTDPKVLERMHEQGQEALRKYNEFLAKEAAEKK